MTTEHRDDLLGGVTVVEVRQAQKAYRTDTGEVATKTAALTAIPTPFGPIAASAR